MSSTYFDFEFSFSFSSMYFYFFEAYFMTYGSWRSVSVNFSGISCFLSVSNFQFDFIDVREHWGLCGFNVLNIWGLFCESGYNLGAPTIVYLCWLVGASGDVSHILLVDCDVQLLSVTSDWCFLGALTAFNRNGLPASEILKHSSVLCSLMEIF